MIRVLIPAILAGCFALPVSAQAPKEPALPKGVEVAKDLSYGPHERNKLDLYYIPKPQVSIDNAIKLETVPLVIWVHGGAWSAGSKDSGNPALKLLDKGFAVAAINYRYSQNAKFPAQIEDCQAAVRFLRANAKQYNLNPNAFGAWGASAGGHLVALMGTAGDEKAFADYGNVKEGSSKVQAVCDWFGPIDMTLMQAQTKIAGKMNHDSPEAPEAKLLGGPVQENKEKAAKANPITYIKKGAPPFLILHGDKDPLVPLAQSEMFHEALKKAGVDSTLIVVKDVGHEGKVGDGKNGDAIIEFFNKNLKK